MIANFSCNKVYYGWFTEINIDNKRIYCLQ